MNSIVRWFFRVGLWCGVAAVVFALITITEDLGFALPVPLRDLCERALTIFGLAFMWLGILLLFAAILDIRNRWPRLSKAEKVVCVLGLGMSTFAGAYIYHWLRPDVPREERESGRP